MSDKTPIVVGLGEVLWDLLPSGKQLGGAPANFAYHAHALGAQGMIISAVGDDEPGKEVDHRLLAMGLETRFLQIHRRYPTGTVSVTLEAGQPRYVIHENVAWDYINWEDDLTDLAQVVDAVCVGSLAQRSFVSRSTIHAFLQHTRTGCLRIFDLNLRQNYYTREIIDATLQLCNVLKLNEHEWSILADMLGFDPVVPDGLAQLLAHYNLQVVALTQGAQGSLLITPEVVDSRPVAPVEVADTIGAGDAFTAALTVGLLRGRPLPEIHAHASRLAAYVCTQVGATPDIPRELRQ
jgi:fructokinase